MRVICVCYTHYCTCSSKETFLQNFSLDFLEIQKHSLQDFKNIFSEHWLITHIINFSKEDVERFKQKDLLEQMLGEMTGEYPALSEVIIKERDTYLAHSLRQAAQPMPHPFEQDSKSPRSILFSSDVNLWNNFCYNSERFIAFFNPFTQ